MKYVNEFINLQAHIHTTAEKHSTFHRYCFWHARGCERGNNFADDIKWQNSVSGWWVFEGIGNFLCGFCSLNLKKVSNFTEFSTKTMSTKGKVFLFFEVRKIMRKIKCLERKGCGNLIFEVMNIQTP